MSERTEIAWTDSTHNFWRGCTKVSPGCARCYAETLVTTRLKGEWGKGKARVLSKNFDAPLKWNKKPWVCGVCGHHMTEVESKAYNGCPTGMHVVQHHRRRVFSLSLGDIFDEEAPIKYLADALDIIRRCPDLVFQLLTKRPEHALDRLRSCAINMPAENGSQWIDAWLGGRPPENIWLGTSIEDQQRADERIPLLLKIPARVRFLSVEPLLSPIEFSDVTKRSDAVGQLGNRALDGINWLIVGGESGPDRRDCGVEAICDVARQCQCAGIPIFVKQDTALRPGQQGRIPDEIWELKQFPSANP